MDSAFPHNDIINKHGTVMQPMSAGMTKFEYFAAHAPDVPSWFEVKSTTNTHIINGESHTILTVETNLETLTRWRIEYAKAMIKSTGSKDVWGH